MIQHHLPGEEDMGDRCHTHGCTLKMIIVVIVVHDEEADLIVLTWMTRVCLANDIGSKSTDGSNGGVICWLRSELRHD
jgi:hypothetical protein